MVHCVLFIAQGAASTDQDAADAMILDVMETVIEEDSQIFSTDTQAM